MNRSYSIAAVVGVGAIALVLTVLAFLPEHVPIYK